METEVGDLLVVYTPIGMPLNLDLPKLNAETLSAYWFNPRNGRVKVIGDLDIGSAHRFTPWASGWGSDFLLLLADKEAGYDFSMFMD